MQKELNHTVHSLLGIRSLEEVPKEQLEGLVLEYPYAAALRLLFTKKLQMVKDPGYADQVSKTALYFNNPHWLNFQLWNRESKALWDDAEPAPPPLKPWNEPSIRTLQAEGVFVNPEDFPADPEDLEQGSAQLETAVATPADFLNHEAIPEDASAQIETGFGFSDDMPAQKENTESSHTQVEVAPAIPEDIAIDPVSFREGTTIPESTAEPLIPLEPYYTIDYFASQGIQLTEAENQDNLGKKLKSFTDWLKTMKKVHAEKTAPAIDAFAEARIKEGADRSNDLKEVWTEAMAEVYLKQGLKHKALEVYQKLSLQNPAQSANFAAKIAELND